MENLSIGAASVDPVDVRTIQVNGGTYYIQKVFAISDDGSRLLIGGTDVNYSVGLKLILWDTATPTQNQIISDIEGSDSVVLSKDFAASFMPGNEQKVFYVSSAGFVEVNLNTRQKTVLAVRLRLDTYGPIHHAAFSSEGGWVAFDKGTIFVGPTLGVKALSCITDDNVFTTLLGQIKADAYAQVIAIVNAQRGQAIPTACADDLITMATYLQSYPPVSTTPILTPTMTATFTPTTTTPTPIVDLPPCQVIQTTIAASDSAGLRNAIQTANGQGTSGPVYNIGLQTGDYYFGSNGVVLPDVSGNVALCGSGAALHFSSNAALTVTSAGRLSIHQVKLTTDNTNSRGYGGVVWNDGQLEVYDSLLENSAAAVSGGAILNAGTLTIARSTFRNNTANNAAAIYNYLTGAMTITCSRFDGNTVLYGGAIRNAGTGAITIHLSRFNLNQSTVWGGGALYVDAGASTIDATNNWWSVGTPDVNPGSASTDSVSDNVNFLPVADTDPTLSDAQCLTTPLPFATETPTLTFTPTNTPTLTPTFTPSFSPTPTATYTATPTATFTPTFAPTNTPTLTPTFTPSFSPSKTPAPQQKLRLTAVCSPFPRFIRGWRVRNPNRIDVRFTWYLLGTPQRGTRVAEANEFTYFYTFTVPNIPNRVAIYVNGVQRDVEASSTAQCEFPSFGDR